MATTFYSSIESLSNAIGEQSLVNYVNDEAVPENDIDLFDEDDLRVKRINAILEKVYDQINGYLTARYELPFAEIPKQLVPISDDMCIYYLVQRRNRNDMPKDIVDAYKVRLSELDKISVGKIILDVANEEPPGMSSEIQTNKKSTDRIFNDDAWSKY